MRIASVLENQIIEKRIAITPEIAKKYISIGIEVSLCENYASHLGVKDDEYKDFRKMLSLLVSISFLLSSAYWINPYSNLLIN